ncbi:zinc-dependent metalloprotease [Chitinimonas lacunae]|uniref:Zinc-dependent metalloprotease n=1 Tax=Chitinimonas lacunae TaxID=1963018 RepID=A0ABV8MSJ4_9NEIS
MSRFTLRPCAALLFGLLALNAFAGEGKPAPAAVATAPVASMPNVPSAARDNSNLKPFSEVIRDAQRQNGLFPIWRQNDKVWLEIPADRLDQPFFFTFNRVRGIGERGIYGGQMGASYVASFKRIGDRIQLIAHNQTYTAKPGTPAAHAVAEGFSDSLLGSTTVVSQAHPERKAILIDANQLLLADIPMGATALEMAFRLPYSFDPRQSSIGKTRADGDISALQVTAHYNLMKLPLPSGVSSSGSPQAVLPSVLEDPRSLFLGYHYSFARLPEPMAARVADDRVGHFISTRWDYSDDLSFKPRVHLVNRWRLEKKDPTAALSEAKQPIVYWLDKNIPVKYRQSVREGVLAWNQAFEKIGIKNAVVVKQQEDDADFDTAEAHRASIRWFVGTDVGFAIGPSHVDPRTGEILDADIGMSDVFTRGSRRQFVDDLPRAMTGNRHDAYCQYAHLAASEMHFSLDMLEARGDIRPDSPEAEKFVSDVVRDVIMHEVGHTLGLRHNFRASTVYTPAQLANTHFTHNHGVAGSVMDYSPTNLALKGESQGAYNMQTLGPYDYWAIEYAYKPITPEKEEAELAKILARSTDPVLAFASDEEAYEGADPEASVFDLGSDPLNYFERRIRLSRELWQRLESRQLAPGQSYAALRNSFESSLRQVRSATSVGLKYIGGVRQLRDHAGSGRLPLTPVPADTQRRALKLLTGQLFAPDSFRLSPDLLRRMTPDRLEYFGPARQPTELNLNDQVLGVQRGVLDRLYNDQVATRILEHSNKVERGGQAFRLSELYDTLQAAIWQEARSGGEADLGRRNLQREQVRQLVNLMTRPSSQTPADARALARDNARELSGWLQTALNKPRLSKETRAHYADTLAMLNEAMKASYTRSGT